MLHQQYKVEDSLTRELKIQIVSRKELAIKHALSSCKSLIRNRRLKKSYGRSLIKS